MPKIEYHIDRRTLIPAVDACYLDGNEPLTQQLAEAVIQTISTDVEIKVGGHEIHLAMLLDPDHWSDDWRKLGVDDESDQDADEFLSSFIEATTT